jgi:hypothetical protein
MIGICIRKPFPVLTLREEEKVRREGRRAVVREITGRSAGDVQGCKNI